MAANPPKRRVTAVGLPSAFLRDIPDGFIRIDRLCLEFPCVYSCHYQDSTKEKITSAHAGQTRFLRVNLNQDRRSNRTVMVHGLTMVGSQRVESCREAGNGPRLSCRPAPTWGGQRTGPLRGTIELVLPRDDIRRIAGSFHDLGRPKVSCPGTHPLPDLSQPAMRSLRPYGRSSGLGRSPVVLRIFARHSRIDLFLFIRNGRQNGTSLRKRNAFRTPPRLGGLVVDPEPRPFAARRIVGFSPSHDLVLDVLRQGRIRICMSPGSLSP
jgi:hypothetical protein